MFDKYIDKWIERKNQATLDGNLGQRTLAKLRLNSLYGKFGTSMRKRSKIPYIGEDEILHYELEKEEITNGLYVPIASFITSYARNKTIRTSQAIMNYSIDKYGKNLYIYSDTDSIHCLLSESELKRFCDIDEIELGAWKCEGYFTKAVFIRQKTYIEEIEEQIKITCAGMPKSCYDYVNFENFKIGFKAEGNLRMKNVKGGVLLVDNLFEIRDNTTKKFLKNFKEKEKKNG